MKTISILNLKGGVAKTFTAVNMAYELYRRGFKVLLIDNDKQGNASRAYGRYDAESIAPITRMLSGEWQRAGEIIQHTEYFMESIGRAAETLTGVMANFMRALGNGMDAAGTVCRNAADYMQPLEIKGNVLSWEVKPVVCDYGVYENNALNGSSVLKLITNSRRAAEKIVEIMQQDNLEHVRLNQPERIQKRQDAADSLRAAVITAYEKGAVENG